MAASRFALVQTSRRIDEGESGLGIGRGGNTKFLKAVEIHLRCDFGNDEKFSPAALKVHKIDTSYRNPTPKGPSSGMNCARLRLRRSHNSSSNDAIGGTEEPADIREKAHRLGRWRTLCRALASSSRRGRSGAGE